MCGEMSACSASMKMVCRLPALSSLFLPKGNRQGTCLSVSCRLCHVLSVCSSLFSLSLNNMPCLSHAASCHACQMSHTRMHNTCLPMPLKKCMQKCMCISPATLHACSNGSGHVCLSCPVPSNSQSPSKIRENKGLKNTCKIKMSVRSVLPPPKI